MAMLNEIINPEYIIRQGTQILLRHGYLLKAIIIQGYIEEYIGRRTVLAEYMTQIIKDMNLGKYKDLKELSYKERGMEQVLEQTSLRIDKKNIIYKQQYMHRDQFFIVYSNILKHLKTILK